MFTSPNATIVDSSPTTTANLGPPAAPPSSLVVTTSPSAKSASRSVGVWRRWGAAPYLFIGDALALLAAGQFGEPWSWATAATLAAGLLTLSALGLYQARLHLSLLDDIPRLFLSSIVGMSAGLVVAAASADAFSVSAGVTRLLAALAALVVVRFGLYVLLRHSRQSGWARHTALVIGAGHVGIRLTHALRNYREYGLDPIGFLDSDPRVDRPSELPAPLLGTWHDVGSVVEQNHVSRVIVAFASLPESELVDVLRTCARLECDIYYVPRLFELHNTSREVDDVRGVPLVRLRRSPYRSLSWRLKRVMDIIVSGTALVLLSPVMALCAIAVRIEGGPRVLFRQERVGLDGRTFEMLKFRSMCPTTESESQTNWTIKDDERVGRVGRLLRTTSLDEMPQLWNVLTGDMSLVGPRPERPHFVSHFSAEVPRYTSRHRVPAGITGWAQINRLRGDTSIAERALYDNYYIENWSLWWDIKILLRTAAAVFGRRGE
ncbi:MAG: sugar transferase [Actinomycetia bacterium]|nr:sugar transferase [Actinomycetes bacterium]